MHAQVRILPPQPSTAPKETRVSKDLIVRDDVISYREMCDIENVQTLQRGMNYRLNPKYSVVLMSQRSNAPYTDRIHEDGITVEYEGHDVSKKSYNHNPKFDDQVSSLPSGKPTQNGLFIKAVEEYKNGDAEPELVKIYKSTNDLIGIGSNLFKKEFITEKEWTDVLAGYEMIINKYSAEELSKSLTPYYLLRAVSYLRTAGNPEVAQKMIEQQTELICRAIKDTAKK